MNKETTKVVYIMGWGRSGSTILDNVLGSVDGFFSAGELVHLWKRGLIEGRRCGCGKLINDCEVWSKVLGPQFGNTSPAHGDPRTIVSYQKQAVRMRHTPRILGHMPGRLSQSSPLAGYASVIQELYVATAETTDARVVVDSSKEPAGAAVLRFLPEVTPFYVHLVRDPRAVAYSWGRAKLQLDRDSPMEMVKHSALNSTICWTAWNLAAEAVRRRHSSARSMVLRYEDFVADPPGALRRITRLVGEEKVELPFVDEHTVRLRPNHTVSGNPSRFATGTVELRKDNDWLAHQNPVDRLVCTGLALPLLARYGYPLRPR